jgi:TatA/E family protein of Tat protein translocase
MLSVPDVLVVSVLALLLFGPDRLPKVMRQAGRFMRDVQNTSHSFVAEMERAADTSERPPPPPPPEPLSLNLKTEPQTAQIPENANQARDGNPVEGTPSSP